MNKLSELQPSLISQAFVCTKSQQVMENPVINLCGHLFDNKVLELVPTCPIDNTPLTKDTCIPLKELGRAITQWKVHQASQPLPIAAETSSASLERKFSVMRVEPPAAESIRSIRNAHNDDIHGMISSVSGFITGSKDTTVKMWSTEGNLIQTIASPHSSGYRSWVTAMCRFNNLWAYGTRDGELYVLDQQGKIKRNLTVPSQAVICKDRNKSRINCITHFFSDAQTTQFYVGTPKLIHLLDGRSAKRITSYSASENDWVYCIDTLPENRLAIVYGSTLQLWVMPPNSASTQLPERNDVIVAPPRPRSGQREHISSIVKLHDQTRLACAVFDGTLRIVDLPTQTTCQRFDEHEGRVWSVVKMADDLIISSADDRKIKIWDLRMSSSIHTIVAGAGRVSSLLLLNAHTLLSGSCPDNLLNSEEKATISFWDLRQFNSVLQ